MVTCGGNATRLGKRMMMCDPVLVSVAILAYFSAALVVALVGCVLAHFVLDVLPYYVHAYRWQRQKRERDKEQGI